LALLYFRFALGLCRLSGVQPSLLLHPLDFLGGDDVSDLAFFPAMQLPSERKLEVMSKILECYSTQFHVVTMRQHADLVKRVGNSLEVKSRQPRSLS
jgi:peptidoglycan-N-acetylglucosamine deacetylase